MHYAIIHYAIINAIIHYDIIYYVIFALCYYSHSLNTAYMPMINIYLYNTLYSVFCNPDRH